MAVRDRYYPFCENSKHEKKWILPTSAGTLHETNIARSYSSDVLRDTPAFFFTNWYTYVACSFMAVQIDLREAYYGRPLKMSLLGLGLLFLFCLKSIRPCLEVLKTMTSSWREHSFTCIIWAIVFQRPTHHQLNMRIFAATSVAVQRLSYRNATATASIFKRSLASVGDSLPR